MPEKYHSVALIREKAVNMIHGDKVIEGHYHCRTELSLCTDCLLSGLFAFFYQLLNQRRHNELHSQSHFSTRNHYRINMRNKRTL